MPESVMDWWAVVGVVAGVAGVGVAFMRRPKKTVNTAVGSKRVTQSGGEGTTINSVEDSEDVRQKG